MPEEKQIMKSQESVDNEEHIFAPLYKNPKAVAEPGRTFYFSRHGESANNLFGKIGGDANLSANGQKYAELLGSYVNAMELADLQVKCYYFWQQMALIILLCYFLLDYCILENYTLRTRGFSIYKQQPLPFVYSIGISLALLSRLELT